MIRSITDSSCSTSRKISGGALPPGAHANGAQKLSPRGDHPALLGIQLSHLIAMRPAARPRYLCVRTAPRPPVPALPPQSSPPLPAIRLQSQVPPAARRYHPQLMAAIASSSTFTSAGSRRSTRNPAETEESTFSPPRQRGTDAAGVMVTSRVCPQGFRGERPWSREP